MTKTVRLLLMDQFEAQLLTEVLRENQFPGYVKSYDDGAYGLLFQQDMGWGFVEIPEEHEQAVNDILAEIRATSFDEQQVEAAEAEMTDIQPLSEEEINN